jgi:hypothetical protein
VDERPEGEGDAESRRRLTSRIAHIDEALRRWNAWNAWRAEHAPDAPVGRRGSGVTHVRHQSAAPALPPLTRRALIELRAMLLEKLDRREQEPANGDDLPRDPDGRTPDDPSPADPPVLNADELPDYGIDDDHSHPRPFAHTHIYRDPRSGQARLAGHLHTADDDAHR